MTKAPGYSGNPETLRIEERRASTQNHLVTGRLPSADRAPARVEPDTLQDGVFHTNVHWRRCARVLTVRGSSPGTDLTRCVRVTSATATSG
jgi:hypothetical protein